MSIYIRFLLLFVTILVLGCQSKGLNPDNLGLRTNVVTSNGKDNLILMDFSKPIRLNPLEEGWFHKTFLFTDPMKISFLKYKDVNAAKFETNSSGSMLIRHVDIHLSDYSRLQWKWLVKRNIESPIDESSSKGDDSAARLYIQFSVEGEPPRGMEIIWARQLSSGNIKQTHGYNHYVLRGKGDVLNKWYVEDLDLLKIYRKFWPNSKDAKIVLFSIFCDSDDTKNASESYFSSISLRKNKK